jgi:hypothetical protein
MIEGGLIETRRLIQYQPAEVKKGAKKMVRAMSPAFTEQRKSFSSRDPSLCCRADNR